jgi:CheY-like chemotaxis protein
MFTLTSPTVYPMSNFRPVQKTSSPTRKRILIIEDDLDMIELVSQSLKNKYNCRIDTASDPFEAMNLIAEKFYDLIILDWQLQGMNGSDALVQTEKGLRLEPALPKQWDFKKTSVVIFSATEKSQCLKEHTRHFNYVGYVSKTQPLPLIIDAFGKFINQQKAAV